MNIYFVINHYIFVILRLELHVCIMLTFMICEINDIYLFDSFSHGSNMCTNYHHSCENISQGQKSTLDNTLIHWGRVTHICVSRLTITGSDNGLSPGRHQAIIWTIAGILLMGPLETNFREILNGNQTFSFKKMHLKMSSAKWRPFVSASMC